VPAAAVAVHDDGRRAVEVVLFLRPALDDDGLDAKVAVVQALGEQVAAGEVVVGAEPVTGAAGQQEDLLLRAGGCVVGSTQ
jgi:hypothetical protein